MCIHYINSMALYDGAPLPHVANTQLLERDLFYHGYEEMVLRTNPHCLNVPAKKVRNPENLAKEWAQDMAQVGQEVMAYSREFTPDELEVFDGDADVCLRRAFCAFVAARVTLLVEKFPRKEAQLEKTIREHLNGLLYDAGLADMRLSEADLTSFRQNEEHAGLYNIMALQRAVLEQLDAADAVV